MKQAATTTSPKHLPVEAGEEKRCLTCGELWPADGEFFFASKSRQGTLMSSCIACIKEKRGRAVTNRVVRTASELTKAYVRKTSQMAKKR
jgi:hypothetical protein